MFFLKLEDAFKLANRVAYIALMVLGCYFVYKGNVWDIFHMKRTNFAVYDEPISEPPTIISWIQYSKHQNSKALEYKLGKDYNVTYSTQPWWKAKVVLEEGENVIPGTRIKVNLEIKNGPNWEPRLKITPLSFSSRIVQDVFRLTYIFMNDTMNDTLMEFLLTTKNNSNCGKGWSHYDGDVRNIIARPGETKWVQMNPEKYVYNPGSGKCRDEPYHDLLLNKIFDEMNKTCKYPCVPNNYWICNKEMQNVFPACKNPDNIGTGQKITYNHYGQDIKCFVKAWKKVGKGKHNIQEKPCTKLQYRLEETRIKRPRKNEAIFESYFSKPAAVTVREEYIIYDAVALVSTIGGTLGIFIGFSFKELITILFSYQEEILCFYIKTIRGSSIQPE